MTREDKKTIIAEIDRLYQVNLGFKKEYRFPSFRRVVIGRLQAYEGLKSYINSLPEPQLPSDVEEAAEKYATEWHKNPDGSAWKPYFEESAIKAFKAGAEWQYQKDRGEFAKIKAKTWKEGFDFYKEQILQLAKNRYEQAMTFVSGNLDVDHALQMDRLALVKIIAAQAKEEREGVK